MSSARLVAVALLTATSSSGRNQVEAIPGAGGDPGAAASSTLFACGSHGDVAAQTTEVVHLFGAL
eukprot:COSAG06_NODE_28559_length_572_cov_0.854123_1_plen_64_part_10